MSEHRHADPGSLGDEAGLLLDAVQDWARRTFGEGDSARLATGAPDCQWCPVCQLVAVLRGERPEATEKIVAAGSALVAALRSAFGPVPSAAPSVQHIDLDG